MTHTFTTRGTRRWRYYTCTTAHKRGRDACSAGALPAGEIESFVVDRIRSIGTDPGLQAEILGHAGTDVHREDLIAKLTAFTPVWDALIPKEQLRIVELLIERIAYDASHEVIAITFRPTTIAALHEATL